MRLCRDAKACYGCRSCELACSYHRHRAFSPGGGAIQVRKDNKTGLIQWVRDSSCDLCMGEDGPLCVRFCPYEALRAEV